MHPTMCRQCHFVYQVCAGIQVDQIKLIFNGKQMNDAQTLASMNITAGAVVHMVLQLRG
jgi:hypothetical protein